jgi:hypothetical protein
MGFLLLELLPAIHYKSSSQKLFFQAPEGASMVALLGQEKSSFYDSGLSISIGAKGSRFTDHLVCQHKNHFPKTNGIELNIV